MQLKSGQRRAWLMSCAREQGIDRYQGVCHRQLWHGYQLGRPSDDCEDRLNPTAPSAIPWGPDPCLARPQAFDVGVHGYLAYVLYCYASACSSGTHNEGAADVVVVNQVVVQQQMTSPVSFQVPVAQGTLGPTCPPPDPPLVPWKATRKTQGGDCIAMHCCRLPLNPSPRIGSGSVRRGLVPQGVEVSSERLVSSILAQYASKSRSIA